MSGVPEIDVEDWQRHTRVSGYNPAIEEPPNKGHLGISLDRDVLFFGGKKFIRNIKQ